MLTLAKILSIQQNSNKCSVHIPLFDVPGTGNKTILPAVINTVPGTHSGYSVDDTVVIGFVDNATNKPIVIGKLFLGTGQEATNRGLVSCSSLDVSDSMTIPITTKIKFTGEPNTFVATDGGYSSYNSIQDLIDALQKHTQELVRLRKDVTLETDQRFSDVQQVLDQAEKLSNTFTNSVAGIKADITQDRASINSLAGWKSEVQKDVSTISNISQIVTDNTAALSSLTAWQGNASTALSAVENKANEHEAKFTALATWQDTTTNSIAEVTETANAAKAEVLSIANWQESVESDVEAIATIRQTAKKAAATTDILTNWGGEGETLTTKLTQLATQDFVGTQISAVKDDINAEFILGVLENDSGSMESFATLVADKIEFEGQELNIKVPATNIVGNLVIGQLPSSVAQTSDIPSESEIVTIAQGAITADHVSALECEFTKGKIGNWCFESDGTLRSAEGIYGTYTYSAKSNNNSGLSNLVVINPTPQVGYAFTALLPQGLAYVIKESNSYKSATKVIIPSSALTSFSPNTSSGGGGSVVMPV